MIELKTLSRKAKFSYDGSVVDGLVIYTGKKRYSAKLTKELLQELLHSFSGKTILIDATRTKENLKEGSLGHWLFKNKPGIVLTSYIAAILVHEGHAEYLPGERIRFR